MNLNKMYVFLTGIHFISFFIATGLILFFIYDNEEFREFWVMLEFHKDFNFDVFLSYLLQIAILITIIIINLRHGILHENIISFFLFMTHWLLVVLSAWALAIRQNIVEASLILKLATLSAFIAAAVIYFMEHNNELSILYIVAAAISLQASWQLFDLNELNN